jgi:uncharacterized cupredoxin-like copper-binding protein
MSKNFILSIGSFFLIIGLLTACGGDKDLSSDVENTPADAEQKKQDETTQQATKEDVKEDENVHDDVNDTTIEVSAFEMGYLPNVIHLKEGQEYELIMTNDGKVFHDLTEDNMSIEITYMSEMADHPEGMSWIEKLFGMTTAYAGGGDGHSHDDEMKNIHLNANTGQTVSIKFIPKEKGEFEFYCTVPGHKEAGMVGKFIVE